MREESISHVRLGHPSWVISVGFDNLSAALSQLCYFIVYMRVRINLLNKIDIEFLPDAHHIR